MCVFERVHICAFAKHDIYGYKTRINPYWSRIYMRTKHAYICVRNTLISAYQWTACLIGRHYQFDAKDFDQKTRILSKVKEEWWVIVRYCTEINSLRFRLANMHNTLYWFTYIYLCIVYHVLNLHITHEITALLIIIKDFFINNCKL